MHFRDIPQFIHGGNYVVDISWNYLESWLESHDEYGGGGGDLNPDFQRGHVWDECKQAAYVEYILKGGKSSTDLWWNAKNWTATTLDTYPVQIVDGKQRLEAVRRFMRNDLRVFVRPYHLAGRSKKGYSFSDLDGKPDIIHTRFRMHVNNLETRAEVLEWYLQLNEGGVVHTDEELAKVRDLLAKEKKI